MRAKVYGRLSEAIPVTRLCTEHSCLMGKYGGKLLVTSTQEGLGTGGNLKRNYGGIFTRKARNQMGIDKLRRDHLENLRSAEGGSG
ncbi:MAG: hypothetical protein ACLQGP_26705 [Isosphaeraceae bacterium]